jgi:hypothetical protein
MFKRVLVESDKWEVARAPNEVRAAAAAASASLLPYSCNAVQSNSCAASLWVNMHCTTQLHCCVDKNHSPTNRVLLLVFTAGGRFLSAVRPALRPMMGLNALASSSFPLARSSS